MPFTAEELAEMRLADEEIEREFERDPYRAARAHTKLAKMLDKEAKRETMGARQRKVAEYHHRYYKEHKEEIRERRRRYYEEHKEEIRERRRRYREEHKEAERK